MENPVDPKPTVSLYGDLAKKFLEFGINDQVVFIVTGKVSSLSRDSVSVEVSSVKLQNTPDSVEEAHRRARNEIYVANRVQPNVG